MVIFSNTSLQLPSIAAWIALYVDELHVCLMLYNCHTLVSVV
jgi:hypothetical protein